MSKNKKDSKHRLVAEHETHFIIHDGEHGFPVPKKSLDKSHMDKIRKLAKFEEPKKMADGGEVEPLEVERIPASEQTPEPQNIQLPEPPKGSEQNPIDIQLPEGAPQASSQIPPLVAAPTDISSPPITAGAPLSNRAGAHIHDAIVGGIGDTAKAVSAVASPAMQFARGLISGEQPGVQPTQTPQAPKSAPISQEQQVKAPIQQPQQASSDPYSDALKGVRSGFGMQISGSQAEAKAKADFGKAMANAAADEFTSLKEARERYEDNREKLMNENDQLFKDVKDSKIDPNKYWNDHGTGGKIGAAISLILGGLAGGLDRTGRNPALEVIQKNIDRDIDAQKANLEKKNSLLSMNFKKLGNLDAAEAVTRSQLLTATAAKLKMAEGQAMGPEAKARAQQATGQILQQAAQYGMKYAELAAKAQIAGGGATQIPLHLQQDKEFMEKVVRLPSGRIAQAYTPKDAETVREQVSTIEPIFNGLEELKQLQYKALAPGEARAKAESIRETLLPIVMENAGLKRLSEADIKNIQGMFTDPTRFESLYTNNAKSDQFMHMLEDKLTSSLKSRIVNYHAPFKPASAKPYQGK